MATGIEKTGHQSQGIASWPEEQRPRERLLSRGPESLTDAELIAILIRVGFKGTSAVELGRQLLKRFGSLRAMAEAPVLALLDVKGLKEPKRGDFSPDFFIKQGSSILVTEIKGDEEINDPSPETVKKHEYATEHFKRLIEWLEREKIPTRYQFNMVTPRDFGKYFSKLRDEELEGFRSELDVKAGESESSD